MAGNHVVNVALVGASGNSGSYMAEALLKTGKHTVTATARQDSKATYSSGIKVARVNYDDESSIVEALRGQDALIITLSALAPHDLEAKLVKAAAEAGVPWILPNAWGPDAESEALLRDLPMLWGPKKKTLELVESIGKSSYISVTTGFWYEWSLSIPYAYRFDIVNRKVTLYDGGYTPMTTSTWPQVGRAVASLLSLPIKPENSNSPSLEQYRNGHVYIESFTLTQNEMFESILRVTGTQKSDWTISQESAAEAHTAGWEEFQAGDRMGMGKWLYGRVMGLDGVGNHAKNRGLANEALKLPKEDLDQYTKIAVDRALSGKPFGSSA